MKNKPETILLALGLSFLASPFAAAQELGSSLPESRSISLSSGASGRTAALEGNISRGVRRADFAREHPSGDARNIADWIVHSEDSRGLPFIVVDKKDARVFVFDPDGKMRGAAPALLGLAIGDNSLPGIGDRELWDIAPEDRTTPAGRFTASIGLNVRGEDVVWVDYDAAVSLHRVITSNPKERRLERLASATPLDNRISYGCINVPAKFYENVVSPALGRVGGIVYVLPEVRSLQEVFAAYAPGTHAVAEKRQDELRVGVHRTSAR